MEWSQEAGIAPLLRASISVNSCPSQRCSQPFFREIDDCWTHSQQKEFKTHCDGRRPPPPHTFPRARGLARGADVENPETQEAARGTAECQDDFLSRRIAAVRFIQSRGI